MVENYGNDSIVARTEAEADRNAPENVLGSRGVEGARHSSVEIVANSLDEANSGFGDLIEISYYLDKAVSVRDFGRGVPLGYNSNAGVENWYLIYAKKFAGGKYGDVQKTLKSIENWDGFKASDFNYLYSVGLYGIGASATQFTSRYMRVESVREGVKTYMDFYKGNPVLPEEWKGRDDYYNYKAPTENTDEPNGTFVKWLPDEEVFDDNTIGINFLKELCISISYVSKVNARLKIEKDDGTFDIIEYPAKSLSELNNETINRGIAKVDGQERFIEKFEHGLTVYNKINDYAYVAELDLSMIPVGEGGKITGFHNSMPVYGGDSFTAVTSAIKTFLKNIKGIKELDDSDIDGLYSVVLHTKSSISAYNGADKKYIKSAIVYQLVFSNVLNELKSLDNVGDKGLELIVNYAQRKVQVRIDAKMRLQEIREIKKASKTQKKISKLFSSDNYDARKYSNSELYIVEGDSALNPVLSGRSRKTQSVIPMRGKVMNGFKHSIQKCLADESLNNLVGAVGAGVHFYTDPEESTFELSKVRFDKIVILTDADIDGGHIRAGLVIFFYLFMPELIRDGRLFILEAPLYMVLLKNGQKKYAINDEEFNTLLKKHGSSIVETRRFKGLGEMNSDDVEATLMGEDRVLRPVDFDVTSPEVAQLMLDLFGPSSKYRKQALGLMLGSDIEKLDASIRNINRGIENDDSIVNDWDEIDILI